MVTSHTGTIIVMGGETENGMDSKAMFELSKSMEWKILKQTLKYDHYWPLVLPIPDDLVYTQDNFTRKNSRKHPFK